MSVEPFAYRAPLRPRRGAGAPAVEYARHHGLVGIGGDLPAVPAGLDEALAELDRRDGIRAAWRVERFARAPEGSYVWSRDEAGFLWLGRLAGPWRYDPAGADTDLVHVRDCTWLPQPVEPAAVPPGVAAAYARGGRNWQRIHAPGTGARSADAWRSRAR